MGMKLLVFQKMLNRISNTFLSRVTFLLYNILCLQLSGCVLTSQIRPQRPLIHGLLPFSLQCQYLRKHRTQPGSTNLIWNISKRRAKDQWRNQRLFLFPPCFLLKTCKLTEKLKDQYIQNHLLLTFYNTSLISLSLYVCVQIACAELLSLFILR